MARSFNGTGDAIAVNTFNGFANNAAFSIGAWIKPAPNNGGAGNKQRTIFCSNTFNVGCNFQLGTNSGTPSILEVDLTNVSAVGTSSGTIADGTWAHAGFTWDGTSAWKFYINGLLSGSGTTAVQLGGASAYSVGKNTNASAFNYAGSMADLFVTSSILTAGQFSGLGQGRRPHELGITSIIFYPFDGIQSPEPDLSGGKNNGTLTGTALASGPPFAMFTPRWPSNLPNNPLAPSVAAYALNCNQVHSGHPR